MQQSQGRFSSVLDMKNVGMVMDLGYKETNDVVGLAKAECWGTWLSVPTDGLKQGRKFLSSVIGGTWIVARYQRRDEQQHAAHADLG